MNIYKQAIEHYGKDSQKIVAIEELSELQKEITKDLRGIGNKEHVIEEIADVFIMIRQLEIIYEIDEVEIAKVIGEKLTRLQKRIACNE